MEKQGTNFKQILTKQYTHIFTLYMEVINFEWIIKKLSLSINNS